MKNISLAALGKDNSRDLRKIAEMIRKEQFDVVALQEVLSGGKAFTNASSEYTKKSILMELGPGWDFKWADMEGDKDARHEGYAFLWNTRRLRPVSVEVDNNVTRTFYPQVCRLNREHINRKPYYARFTPSGTSCGGPYIEFRLLCVHTYYGNDSSEARAVRKRELDVLMKDIFPQVADRVYMGNMKSYTIMLGDYNVELYRTWKENARTEQNKKRKAEGKPTIRKPAILIADENDIVEVTRWGTHRIKTVQDEYTTLKRRIDAQTDSVYDGRGYAHDYDHFSFEEKQFEGLMMNARRIDAVRKYCNDDFEKYSKTVSDHIPIMMEIEFKQE